MKAFSYKWQDGGNYWKPRSIMATQGYLLLISLLLAAITLVISSTGDNTVSCSGKHLKRCTFGDDFIFGAGSAAYQFEGAANEDGRGPSIWDTYTTRYPGRITNGSNGNVAIDTYHRYKDDVAIMKNMGLDAFRISISWSRVLPRGRLSGGVNRDGIQYYSDLIDELLANGIRPFVTLFHFDTPQSLEYEYGGFLSSKIVNDFRDYAELCFWEFGDRVKDWVTFNEPYSVSYYGYGLGALAPGRCSSWQDRGCLGGDAATEPYITAHNQLLAHAAAVKLYRDKFQPFQGGKIGIILVSVWYEPLQQTEEDKEAQQRGLSFTFGWFMQPLITGAYPKIMQEIVGSRLPTFNEEETKLLKGSIDFLGLNYYTGYYVTSGNNSNAQNVSYDTDKNIELLYEDANGVPIGIKGTTDWLYSYPKGIQKTLKYISKNYNISDLYITENGFDGPNNISKTIATARNDSGRIQYHQEHLCYLHQAIKSSELKFNVKGYFAWSLMDNFEWADGYNIRFGMIYIDYKNGLTRYPKHSAIWYTNFLKGPQNCTKAKVSYYKLRSRIFDV